jgi:uncharacterized cupin superfamily protein
VHRDEDEAFHVLEGAVDFVCGDERFRAEAGAFVFLETGDRLETLLRPHGVETVGPPLTG